MFAITYGVAMVKPRTAGTREMRVAAATENFMASSDGRQKTRRGQIGRAHV